MPHIHTEPGQHDHTASVYLFRLDFAEPKILLHFHRKLHAYMQFGGHIELNEHPMQAAAHELYEESGYDMSQVRILQPQQRLAHISDSLVHPQPIIHSTHPIGKDHFHTDSAYAAVTHEAPRNNPGEGESTDIRLFTRSELLTLPAEQTIENMREIALYAFDVILPTWQEVAAETFLTPQPTEIIRKEKELR